MQVGVKEASLLLNVSDKTIYRWVKQGNLPYFKDNGSIRFYKAELLEWALKKRINIHSEFQGSEESSSTQTTLKEALKGGGIHYRICGESIPILLSNVTKQLRVLDETDQNLLLKFLIARENLGSTGIGNGISIPHPRNPIITHIPKPIISLNFLEKPIDYKAIDRIPVHTLFLLVSPTVKDHLNMLSKISFALRDSLFSQAIQSKENREVLLKYAEKIDLQLEGNRK